jgi:hypothetical protein
MTAVCTPHDSIAMTMTGSCSGPRVQEPPREADQGRLVVAAVDRDGGTVRLTQEKEVVHDG